MKRHAAISASLQLAWRYVSRHGVQTGLLALALGLVLALPLSIRMVVNAAEAAMRTRANATPQVLGARGSALDLLFTALYFKRQPLPTIPAKILDDLRNTGLCEVIPLYVRFHSQQAPIVGTEIDYFAFRGLQVKEGRMMSRVGDCVVGARLAAERGLTKDSHIFSSQEQVFDLAGIYPLKLRVTGILASNGTADDDAVFTDLKTTWMIQGLGHGHDDLVNAPPPDTILKKEDGNTVANASVKMFNEVTDASLASFHFHGDTDQYPLSAIIVLPNDSKAETLLAGRYLKSDSPAQMIRPQVEFENLMNTLFRIENMLLGLLVLTALAALAVAALVFALSFRLRQRQFETLRELGISTTALATTKCLEIGTVGLGGCLVAVGLCAAVKLSAGFWMNLLLTQ